MILSPELRKRFEDSNGNPLAGGKLYTYAAGTTTPRVTYANQTGSANTNPVILDASGYADVWLDPSLAYKFVLKDSNEVTQWSIDQVTATGGGIGTWNPNTTYATGDMVTDASGNGLLYVSLQDNNTNRLLTDVAYWRMFDGAVRTITSSGSATVADNLIRSNSTSANVTVTLPAISSTPVGKVITVKDVGSSTNTTSVKGAGSDTVDGNNTFATALKSKDQITVKNNGTSWDVVGAYIFSDGFVTATAKLADGIVTQAKMAARATGTTVAAGGVALSSSSGSFTTTNTSFDDVTNLSVTITTLGNPVEIKLIDDGTGGNSFFGVSSTSGLASAQFNLLRGATSIATPFMEINSSSASSPGEVLFPPSAFAHTDYPAAGQYTYKLQLKKVGGSGGSAQVSKVKLQAYEIK